MMEFRSELKVNQFTPFNTITDDSAMFDPIWKHIALRAGIGRVSQPLEIKIRIFSYFQGQT